MENVLKYINDNQKRYVNELIELLKIESVSADSTKKGDVRRCAEYLLKKLTSVGFENAKLCETGGHPAVYADWLHAKGKPTILVYGHYDVVQVDPVEEWKTPPFEPTIKGNDIYGRGTADDKGQLLTHYFALEAILKNTGKLPCNIKFFLEGEEEGMSEKTYQFVEGNGKLLACDAVTVSDNPWYSEDKPTLCCGLRGVAYFEVNIKGPNRDLHSGMYGGMLQNPLNAIAKMIAKMQDENGIIQIPGFYDDVIKLTDADKKDFALIGNEDAEMVKDVGVPSVWGEKGYTSNERNWARPSFDVHGMWGGFSGENIKYIIPTGGGFKFSFRLVANQDPMKIEKQVKKYINSICPPGVTCEIKMLDYGSPVIVPTDNFYVKTAISAFERVFKKRPIPVRSGAAIPVTAIFQKVLEAPTILIGYGLPDDNIHSPNEKFNLDHFYKGILTNVYMYEAFGNKPA